MRRTLIIIAISSLLLTTGCWRRWVDPVVKYPIIPIGPYPEYKLPKEIETEEDKNQIVDALLAAEKYGVGLEKKVKIYNSYARGKNGEAKDLFK